MDLTVFDPTTTTVYIFFSVVVSPLIIALLKQTGLSSKVNSLIALGVYAVVGIVAALMSGVPLTIENAVTLITVGTLTGRAAYSIFWSNFGEEALTARTSLVKA